MRRRAAGAWQRQLEYLRRNSGIYRDLPEVALDDLRRLPLTTKQDLRRALDAEPPWGSVVDAGFAPVLVVTSRALSGWRIATWRPAPGASTGAVEACRRSLRLRVFDRKVARLH